MYGEEILQEIIFLKVVRAMESQWNQGFNTVVKAVKHWYQEAMLSYIYTVMYKATT